MAKIKYIGEVVETLPNTMFLVEYGTGDRVICYLSGKMWINKITILLGDRVEFELAATRDRGRIITRLRK